MEANRGATHGCIRRYPNAKKITKGRTDRFFLYIILRSIKPAHKKMAEYAQILLSGNQDPEIIPNIIDIRKGIIGRE
ncbi:MAG: hypothetical protein U9Q84_03785 [Thermodesulfobacteriota bacterium]|nr:hypothetical protein [Thermodesulfobacteriota bacterium]